MSDRRIGPVTSFHTGLGWISLIGVIFVCAKVFGVEPVASWSWFWVLSPFWIGWLAIIAILVAFVVVWTILERR